MREPFKSSQLKCSEHERLNFTSAPGSDDLKPCIKQKLSL